MELAAAGRVRIRAALLWLIATTALAGLATLALPPARSLVVPLFTSGVAGRGGGPEGRGTGFADLLVEACAVVALVAVAALWITVTDVVSGVLRTGGRPSRRPVGSVRRLLLAACGVAVLAGTAPAAASSADIPSGPDVPAGPRTPAGPARLDGLPLPDRPLGRAAPRSADPRGAAPHGVDPHGVDPHGADPQYAAPTIVVVRPGDSLWSIAARHLGPEASQTDVASYWVRLQALNAATLAPDPDLIRPGQSLRLPPG